MSAARQVAALLAAAGVAAGVARGAEADGARRALEQKAQLVHRLLGDSPAAQRIADSGNEEARRHFAAAARHRNAADAALAAGEPVRAENEYNEALWLVGKARQLVPDSMKRAIEHRFRYAQLLASVESLEQAYRAQRRDAQNGAHDAALARVVRMVEQAKAHRIAEQLPEANRALLQAQNALLATMDDAYRGRTIDYTPRFRDASDEFRFELDRNQSYGELVPIALAELRPQPEAQLATQRHVAASRQLKREAEQLAAARNFDAALRTIRAGTEELQRALAAAGLAVPQRIPER